MRRFQDFYKKVNEQEDIDPENFQDETDLEIEPVAPKTIEPLSKMADTETGGSLDANFQKLLEFQMQIRVFHWGTEVYSEHQAAGLTYDSIDAIMDTLVEAYQGYVGRIKFKGQYTLISYAEVDAFSWMSTIEDTIKQFRSEIEYTDVQNILDELQGAISKFKYLLTLKK
jgi:DNA-binding ferritin-like protein